MSKLVLQSAWGLVPTPTLSSKVKFTVLELYIMVLDVNKTRQENLQVNHIWSMRTFFIKVVSILPDTTIARHIKISHDVPVAHNCC